MATRLPFEGDETDYGSQIVKSITRYTGEDIEVASPSSAKQNPLKKCFDLVVKFETLSLLILELKIRDDGGNIVNVDEPQQKVLCALADAGVPVNYCYNAVDMASNTPTDVVLEQSVTCPPREFNVLEGKIVSSDIDKSLKDLVDELRSGGFRSEAIHLFTESKMIDDLRKLNCDMLLVVYSLKEKFLATLTLTEAEELGKMLETKLKPKRVLRAVIDEMSATDISKYIDARVRAFKDASLGLKRKNLGQLPVAPVQRISRNQSGKDDPIM